MNALQISSAAITPASELQTGLFDEFIAYIGRGEKTTKTYIINLRQFAAWLKYAGVLQPIRKDIIAYRDYLASDHDAIQLDSTSFSGWSYRTDAAGNRYTVKNKPNTIAQYLRSVCQFFRWTAAAGYYPNIAENIHAPKTTNTTHKKEALQAADVLAIENSIERTTEAGKRLFAMYMLAVNAGLRTVEISRADIKNLETVKGQTFLYLQGKGHSEADQKKALAPEVKAALDEYLESRTDAKTKNSPLFVSTGNRSGGQRIAPETISKMLKRAMQAAGYDSDRLTAHSLRHTAAQGVLQITGDNIYKTQTYLRHSNPATTEIYLRETDAQTAEQATIAQELFRYYHGTQTGADKRKRLEDIMAGMNEAQLEQLATIAAAMAH